VDRLLAVQARYVQKLQEVNAKGVIRDIADALISDPSITVPMMSERFQKTPAAVSAAVQRLIELNILSGPYGTYGRQYVADDVWQTLILPVGSVPERDAPLLGD
jgi:hypothetical protein